MGLYASQPTPAARLSAMFAVNMAFLQANNPALHQKFNGYSPQHTQLAVDDDGLVNLHSAKGLLYPSSPVHTAKNQLAGFLANPTLLRSSPVQPSNEATASLTQQYHRKLTALGAPAKASTQAPPLHYLPICVCLGNGLGYHLPLLVSALAIDHLIIVEPDVDYFYGSLFTIDYQKISSEFFQKKGRSIELLVGESTSAVLQSLFELKTLQQAQYLTTIALFSHYESNAVAHHRASIQNSYAALISKDGFIDDEILSVQHTRLNLRSRKLFLSKQQQTQTKISVLVGSGPSVDDAIPMLQSIRHLCTIISTSSSIHVCIKHNIIPDFHVESERISDTVRSLEILASEEVRQKTTLLSLNPAHPNLSGFFQKTYLAFKGNDICTQLLEAHTGSYSTLLFANPLSGNGALDFAITLGFKTVVLVGFDCGYSCDSHHSKDSLYYTNPNDPLGQYKGTSTVLVKNTQGLNITSDLLLTMSRDALEGALQQNPGIRCINTGTGAHLEHTTWMSLADTKQCIENHATGKNHKDPLAQALPDHTQDLLLTQWQGLISQVQAFKALFVLPPSYRDCDQITHQQAFHLLEYVFSQAAQKMSENLLLAPLLKGTLHTFNTALATQLRKQQPLVNVSILREGLDLLQALLNDAIKNMSDTPAIPQS